MTPRPLNYSDRIIHGAYYPHIDGIRALAVLPVVLFHVLARLCPGGFAGVDVFFVISGYLITGGILRDLEKDQFTIHNFYHRRIRRIMPAYFMLIAGVFATGCALYYSLPLIHLGDASVMGTLFSANIYFWKLGGDYFAPDIHTNPLLHLWSLSVEEQFYLFIPLLCALVWKFRHRWVAPTLATLAVLSLAGAVYAVATGKQGNAFYLLHFRAWELLAGSLLAMLPAVKTQGEAPTEGCTTETLSRKDASRKRRIGRKLIPSFRWRFAPLATTGLLMVLIPYAVLSSKTPFPGAAALSSVVGTALLIRYGQSGWINALLSWRPCVAIGKISYSLYLWHWPVTVFWKYAVYDQLYFYDYIGMFLLSLLLAYLSWRFVEVPVRTSPAWTMRRSFAFAGAGIVLLVSIGTLCVFQKGWPTILHRQANSLTNERPRFVESLIRNKIRQVKTALGHTLPFNDFVPFSLGGGGISIWALQANCQMFSFLETAMPVRFNMVWIVCSASKTGVAML
jgi:peptidoglycan/LPS O-acetylase OafA/YrhL